jgi:RNase P/RNase MRP subunit p29
MSKILILIVSLLLASSVMAAEIPLNNPDFEKPMTRNRIPGWSRTQHAGVGAYEVTRDAESFVHGKHSIRMQRMTEQVYGLILQRVESSELAGKPVKLTASMKTSEVGEKGWVMVMTFKHFNDDIEQFRSAPMVGDSDWTEVELRKQAPKNTTRVEIGFMLLDGGTGWVDNVQLHTLDAAETEAKTAAKELPVKKAPADKKSKPAKATPAKAKPPA